MEVETGPWISGKLSTRAGEMQGHLDSPSNRDRKGVLAPRHRTIHRVPLERHPPRLGNQPHQVARRIPCGVVAPAS